MKERQTRLESEISKVRERYLKRKTIFHKIMKTAERIEEENPYALKDLVRVLGMKWQMDHIIHPLMYESSHIPIDPYIEWFSLWCDPSGLPLKLSPDGKDFYDLGKTTGQSRSLSLARDLIIPIDIKSEQFRKALFCLREAHYWTPIPLEHRGLVWEPTGIAMVEDADGLITRRLLQGKGEIEIRHVHDYSAVYEFVHCDGENFIRTWDGYELAPVFDTAFAAIYEIGRIFLKRRKKEWHPLKEDKS